MSSLTTVTTSPASYGTLSLTGDHSIVGGEILDLALSRANQHARFVICGGKLRDPPVVRNLLTWYSHKPIQLCKPSRTKGTESIFSFRDPTLTNEI